MSRIVILRKWEPILPIYAVGVRLERLYCERNNVICLSVPYTGPIPKSEHFLCEMQDENEMANAVCNMCMRMGVKWVCMNSEHDRIEPLGFHLCGKCHERLYEIQHAKAVRV